MSASADIQSAIAALLEAPGALPVVAPVIRRREKEFASDLDAGAAVQHGLCIFVMPPVPTSAVQGVPFVFFDGYEVRVRIIELPQMNTSGADTYELIDAVALALHWQPKQQESALTQILSYPLRLAQRPVEMVEGTASGPGTAYDGKFLRVADVVFNAVLQINA
jgi:hypothetical protein